VTEVSLGMRACHHKRFPEVSIDHCWQDSNLDTLLVNFYLNDLDKGGLDIINTDRTW
jgi:hypothetical protein